MARFLFSLLSIVLLLLAIASFFYALWSIREPIECFLNMKFPEKTTMRYKTTIGTVSDIKTTTTSSYSYREGRSISTSSTEVIIKFYDEKKHYFQITCNPIFNNFKEKSSVKVLYNVNSFYENLAEASQKLARENNKDYVETVGVSGIPLSLLYWIQRPLLFIFIGCILLILRFPANQFKNFF